jgi:hypothetical protein
MVITDGTTLLVWRRDLSRVDRVDGESGILRAQGKTWPASPGVRIWTAG